MLQVVIMTGLGPIFHSSELPYQALAVCLLAGHALGYRLRGGGPLLITICLLLPSALTGIRGLGADVEGSSLPSAALGLALATLSTAALAQLTLVLWARLPPCRHSLTRLYSLEMAGSALGLLLAAFCGPWGSLQLFPWLALVAFAARNPRAWLYLPLVALQCFQLGPLMRARAQAIYGPDSNLLEARFSPYQLVEVVEDQGQARLYLNGLCHHDASSLTILNYYLSALPANLLSPQAAKHGCLVLGGGGLLSPTETLKAGLTTTVVELDPVVLELSSRHLAPRVGLNLADPKLQLVCSDARSYTRQAQTYGLIVVSLPYPTSLNVASLFTTEYLQSLRGRLAPGGILSIFLGSAVQKGPHLDPVARSILRGVRDVFPHSLAISSQEMQNTVVLCRWDSSWQTAQVTAQCHRDGYFKGHLLGYGALDKLTREPCPRPLSLWNFSACARINWENWKP